MLVLALACQVTWQGDGADTAAPVPGPEFTDDGSVRIRRPQNGQTVSAPFELQYEVGDDVADVEVRANGRVVSTPPKPDGDATLSLDDDRYQLALVGFDGDGNETDRHTIELRVVGADSDWVTLVSPTPDAATSTHLRILVDASSDGEVEVFADGASLGTTLPGQLLLAEVDAGTVELEAHSADASDVITVRTTAAAEPGLPTFNGLATPIRDAYPTDGTHDYYWPQSGSWAGTTRDIVYQDTLVAEGDPQGRCYCVGSTWELFMRTLQEELPDHADDLNGLDASELLSFRTDWYVRDLYGPGVGDAVANYALGETVHDLEAVEPGDFLQWWRFDASGHSGVFLGWNRDDDGAISGVRFWACQGSTDGMGETEEDFGLGSPDIDPSFFTAARVAMPDDWGSW